MRAHLDEFEDMMHFDNRLRILLNIDMAALVEAGAIQARDMTEWSSFCQNPYRWFIRTDDETKRAVWAVMMRREVRS